MPVRLLLAALMGRLGGRGELQRGKHCELYYYSETSTVSLRLRVSASTSTTAAHNKRLPCERIIGGHGLVVIWRFCDRAVAENSALSRKL